MARSTVSRPPASPAARSATPAPAAGYHHGDLKTALLDAAESILLEHGVEGFTLRECARRAGVSHAAPAHHFGDAQGLLTEFAALGFERMRELMLRYRKAAPTDTWSQSRAVGQAYIDFAIAHRAHFQLMFRQDRLARDSARLQEAGKAAFDELRSALSAALGPGLAPAAVQERLLLAWSTVHGFATLLLEQRLDPFRGGDSVKKFGREMGQALLRLLEEGLAGSGTVHRHATAKR